MQMLYSLLHAEKPDSFLSRGYKAAPVVLVCEAQCFLILSELHFDVFSPCMPGDISKRFLGDAINVTVVEAYEY